MEDDVKKKAPTEVRPFNLTKPKPKVIEKPQVEPRGIKAKPVPKHIYKKSLAEIEKEKEERRKSK